ncbi:MAG: superinfection immunity protein [Candidatus Pacebacteria bacterium]|nr:superinfection immunity protein [Candidatus Paceibacterota bacterium]
MKIIRVVLAVLLSIGTLGYLLPTTIAIIRRRTNTMAIFVLNLFLGWTLIGWVVALVWSVATDTPKPVTQQAPN